MRLCNGSVVASVPFSRTYEKSSSIHVSYPSPCFFLIAFRQKHIESQCVHDIQEVLVAVNLVVFDMACGKLVEKLLGAANLGLFNRSKLQGIHRSLGFRNKENVLYRPGIERDSPVGRIIPYWCRNAESLR